MSILEEPPGDRQPIQTLVCEYNEELVREAISRELVRGGQVYYVYNRVNNIADITAYRPGCVVIPVHTMGFQNCDTTFDKVFVDDIGHVKHFRYFDQFKSIAEVSAVIRGEAFGRQHKRERILVYNIGIALHDIYFANKMLEQLPTAPDVDLCGPTEKMWLM